MKRTALTLSLYATYGCLGYILAGMGAILPELRAERDLPRTETALYPSGFALGLIVVGLFGPRVAGRLGRFAVPVALACLTGGTALLAAGTGRLDSGLGALALGLGGAGLVLVVPAQLRAAHRSDEASTVALTEANAVSSAGSVLAPLLIGAALAVGVGWRAGFAGVPLLAALVVLAFLLSSKGQLASAEPADAATMDAEPAGRRAPRAFLGWWSLLVLAVAAEFCLLFWSADYLRTEQALAADAASATSAGFVVGMAAGRAGIGPALRWSGGPLRLLLASSALATTGVILFWASPGVVAAVAGLVLAGLGIALLYPVTLGQALASWPANPVRAAARCALASGLAIGSAPLLLATVADITGLRPAFLITPALLAVFLFAVIRRPTAPAPGDSGRPGAEWSAA